jgi:succinylarginine dihydrolase
VANLVSKFHRSIEPATTSRVLQAIFKDAKHFAHHDPLPSAPQFGDEGAANHTRLCAEYSKPGVQFFVYGRHGFHSGVEPRRFPARQTFEASRALARLHQLNESALVLAQQSPEAIDAGVFHNDVAGVGNLNVYFYHEQSFLEHDAVSAELKRKFVKVCGQELQLIRVPASAVSLQDAVSSYLFNSQLISLPHGGMALILPEECRTNSRVATYLGELLSSRNDLIREAIYFDLKQSMRNGGGPACLRLRVALNDQEIRAAHHGVFLTDALYSKLVNWGKKRYRDRLSLDDLRDPKLLTECREALDELTQILGIGSVYPFQLIIS